MPSLLGYDLETSGKGIKKNGPKAFIAVLQFGAIIYDPNGNPVERINWRARPPRNIIPEPGALAITRQRIGNVMSAPLSQCQLISKINKLFEDKAPASIVSFNGIKYDEEVLRFAQYQNLFNPYQTQLQGNTRLDIMKAAQAAVAFDQSALSLKVNEKSKFSFKLDDLAAANGHNEHDAHEAIADVEAMRFLQQALAKNAPQIARACNAWQNKARMMKVFEERRPLVQLGWNHTTNAPIQRTIIPIVADAVNNAEWLCVDADQDFEKLRGLSAEALKSRIKTYKGIRCIKANAMPTVVPAHSTMGQPFAKSVDPASITALLSDQEFAKKLLEAKRLRREEFQTPKTVWERLYSGGFFPCNADKHLFAEYHRAEPHLRWEIAQNFSDMRARELARWQIGSEWPFVMNAGDRNSYEDELREHLYLDEADWMTVPRALRVVEEMLFEASEAESAILEEYLVYLERFDTVKIS